jgi:hypothetical protein
MPSVMGGGLRAGVARPKSKAGAPVLHLAPDIATCRENRRSDAALSAPHLAAANRKRDMRAETQATVEDIKQSVGLLRRHL